MQTLNTLLYVVQVLTAITLVGLVLVQHGKGADAGAAFGSGASSTVFGSQGSGSFISRLTATLAAVFLVNSLLLAYLATAIAQQREDSVLDRVPVEVSAPENDMANPAALEAQESSVSDPSGEAGQDAAVSLPAAPAILPEMDAIGAGAEEMPPVEGVEGSPVAAGLEEPGAGSEADGAEASHSTPASEDVPSLP